MRVTTLLVFVLGASLTAQDPPPGDLGDLSCRLLRTEPVGETALLIEVAVRHSGERFAEPVEFVVRLRGEEHRVRRFPLPEVGRRGRAVPAGGESAYWLQVPTALRPRGRSGIEVTLARTMFHDGPAIEDVPVTIGRIRHEDVSESGVRFDASILETANSLDRPVDVLLLAECEKPVRGRWLFPVRVEPGAGGTLSIHEAASGLDWDRTLGRVLGVRIRRAEVVDWTAVFDVEDAPVRDDFAVAWNAWYRWERPPVGWGGRFAVRTRVTSDGAVREQEVRGRFAIGEEGEPTIEVEAVDGTDDRRPPTSVFAQAFADLRHPTLEELKNGYVLVPLDRTRVRLRGESKREELGDTFEVGGGRIVGSTDADSAAHYGWTWTSEPLGDGYVVTGREQWQKALGTTIRERRRYVVLTNGVAFPSVFQREQTYGNLRTEYELVIGDLAPEAAVAAAVPAGAAADAVRAAWNAVYSYPSTRSDLVADLEVKHPNTDGVWGGVRRVHGKLTLRGFRGFAMHGAGWSGCEFAAAEQGLSPAARAALENAVDDRLRLWAGRDLAGRASFDEVFRGAEIREASPGVFVVDGCLVSRIVIADGVPRAIDFAFDRQSTFSWKKVGGALVPVEIRSGDEVLTARFRDLGDGLIVPIELRFEHVFGRDWGPETLILRNPAIER